MKLLTYFALAYVLTLLGCNVQAATIPGDEQACIIMANGAVSAVEARDAGMPWADADELLKRVIAENTGTPNSIIQDADDAVIFYDMYSAVWHTEKAAFDISYEVYERCMAGEKTLLPL